MCAIAGIIASDGQSALARILGKLAHRGPDNTAIWSDPDGAISLGCARLITTDPTRTANQPLVTADGRFVLVFNGYIAGHRRKIADLVRDGAYMQSQNDAELVLHLLARAVVIGDDVAKTLGTLSGQYALAFWDVRERSLWLARDPVGIKPLYVCHSSPTGDLAFASELAALGEVQSLRFDHTIRARYLAHLFAPAPASGAVDIELLKPGSVICWQNGAITRSKITHPAQNVSAKPTSFDRVSDLRQKVRQSVADAMDVDCALGCLVSGGLDSAGISAIACDIAREQGRDLPPAFVMGFDDPARDETDAARKLCDHLGQTLCIVRAPKTGEEIYEELIAGLGAVGAPFANPSIVLMQRLASRVGQDVRVCLTGDGGDELFGGYPRYRAAFLYDRYWQYVPRPLRQGAARIGKWTSHRELVRFLSGGCDDLRSAFDVWNSRCAVPEFETELAGITDSLMQNGNLADQMMQFDRDVTLPGNQLVMSDRCGMAFGLEYRLPLLGHDVIRSAAAISATQHLRDGAKSVWRDVIGDHFPAWHLGNRKIGFNPPLADWLAKLGTYLWGDDVSILNAVFGETGLPKERQRMCWTRATSGRDADMTLTVWALMVWKIWEMIDGPRGDILEHTRQKSPGQKSDRVVAADMA